jgi:hypothetical protein
MFHSPAVFYLFIFYIHHVYNGYGDCNISFTFKCLHLSVFFLVLLIFEKGKSAIGFSTWKTENTPVIYNSEALHITVSK